MAIETVTREQLRQSSRLQLVLHVEHRKQAKMVGKVFPVDLPDRGLVPIFYHAESGTQEHHALDSPGGLDWAVLEFLQGNGIDTIHHFDNKILSLWITTVQDVLDCGIEQTWDARTRLFLPRRYWSQSVRWYSVPWITAITTVRGAIRARQNPTMF
jgi:hypothetical protein